MNIARLRELAAAGKDGTIRPEELKELFEALPEVLGKVEASEPKTRQSHVMCKCGHSAWSHFASNGSCKVLLPFVCDCTAFQ